MVSTVKVLTWLHTAVVRPGPWATHLLASDVIFCRALNLVVVLVLVTVSTTTEACSCTPLGWPAPEDGKEELVLALEHNHSCAWFVSLLVD